MSLNRKSLYLDALRSRAEKAEAERDEARREVELANFDGHLARAEAAEAERDEYKQAADAEAFIADEFRARLIAAKTVMPDWTPEGWDAFIDAALAPSATGGSDE